MWELIRMISTQMELICREPNVDHQQDDHHNNLKIKTTITNNDIISQNRIRDIPGATLLESAKPELPELYSNELNIPNSPNPKSDPNELNPKSPTNTNSDPEKSISDLKALLASDDYCGKRWSNMVYDIDACDTGNLDIIWGCIADDKEFAVAEGSGGRFLSEEYNILGIIALGTRTLHKQKKYGISVEFDLEKAIMYFSKSWIGGNVNSALNLIEVYTTFVEYCEADNLEATARTWSNLAIKMARDLVSAGNTKAMIKLGKIYEVGNFFTKPNTARAMEFFRLGSAKKDPDAMFELGVRVLENNAIYGIGLLQLSGEYGNVNALSKLTEYYYNIFCSVFERFPDGQEIKDIKKKIVTHCNRAMNKGHYDSAWCLGEMYIALGKRELGLSVLLNGMHRGNTECVNSLMRFFARFNVTCPENGKIFDPVDGGYCITGNVVIQTPFVQFVKYMFETSNVLAHTLPEVYEKIYTKLFGI